ncbi:MAG: sodium:alanine symporter family protein [Chlamydiia bacterium]|nr:sodium:alanine symporter family protein [Chlamydiia bacterium]
MQQTYHIPPLWTGLALVALTTLVMLGGVGVVGRLASVIVPFMAIGYIGTGICVLARYSDLVWPAFQAIFYEAMHGSAVLGGLAGGGILLALQLGVSRGICSNESGLGSTAIAAAAARTDCAVRQGLLAMLGPLVATLGVCSITGLVLIVTGSLDGVWNHSISLQGSALVVQAFGDNVPLGDHIVTFGLLFFAYSTTMAWSYYGVQCAEYLAGRRLVNLYRIVYVFLLLPGAIGSVQAVWAFADTMNGLMAIPNLIGVFALRKVVRNETKRYFSKVSSALHVQEVKG